MKDYYKTLGVHRHATFEMIKKAYRKLSIILHPDRGGDEAKFKLLVEAYKTLIDPELRQQYDTTYGLFQETSLEESAAPSHHARLMPGKAKPYSLSYQEEHRVLVSQYYRQPLNHGSPYYHTYGLVANLYTLGLGGYEETYHTIYDYINAMNHYRVKSKLKTPETLVFTPMGMVKVLLAFLRGDYCGVELRKLIISIEISLEGNEAQPDYLLLHSIYEIIALSKKLVSDHYQLILAIKKIVDYAKKANDDTLRFMAPLFYNKYFRGLYAYAIHLYWDDPHAFNIGSMDAFDGIEKAKAYVESLQYKLKSNQDNPNLIKVFRFIKMLFQFDRDSKRSFSSESEAVHFRSKAFHLLDWLPFMLEGSGKEIIANVYLQIGLAFQQAARFEGYPPRQMADEALALKMYMRALGIAHHANPALEIYITTNLIKYLSVFLYENPVAKEIIPAFKKRLLKSVDIFPFFDTFQSNMDFFEGEHKTLDLIRRFLKKLVEIYEYNNNHNDTIITDHKNSTILYQAYEACLKNWYADTYDPLLEQKFRLDLMAELLLENKWQFANVQKNLLSPWIMVDRDHQGWIRASRSCAFPHQSSFALFQSIDGVEINNQTGEIVFFLKPWNWSLSVHEKKFSSFDIHEMLSKNISAAIFILDPVDPDLPYHPFNLMRFSPPQLAESEFLNTMLLTDYILKFLTTHQEVQGQYPFDQRPIEHMLAHLPAYLRKIVDDFRNAEHVGALHRFWIEAEEIDVFFDNVTYGDITRIGVGHLKMTVKKHRMERDMHGELRDVGNEDEGWPIYVLTPTERYQLLAGERIIQGHAMIFIIGTPQLFYWENNEILKSHIVQNYRQPLLRLFNQARDIEGKINPTTKNMPLLYRITKEMAQQSEMAHRYSAEFIFAHEFTTHYDEFAQYLPEFGRLKELCKMSTLVRFLSGIHQANLQELTALRSILNNSGASSSSSPSPVAPDATTYEKYKSSRDKVSQNIYSIFDELRGKTATPVLTAKWTTQLNDILTQINPLHFDADSDEINKICEERYYEIIADNPSFPTQEVWDAVTEQRSMLAQKLSEAKQASVKKQLTQSFSAVLSTATAYQKDYFINELMQSNIQPLLSFLIAHERNEVAQDLYSKFSHSVYTDILEATDDWGQNAAWRVGFAEANYQLREIETTRTYLDTGFKQLHFAEEATHKSSEEQCFWVPASVRHDVKIDSQTGLSRYSFFVYGGVSAQPKLNVLYQKVGPNGEHLKFGITQNPATRYTAAQLGGGHLRIVAQGTRKEMLQLERNVHSTLPIGPEERQRAYVNIQVAKGYKAPPYK